MNKITEELLEQVSDYKGEFKGAYNIRENGQCVGRQSSKNIRIEPKKDKSGIDIHIAPNTNGERVYIPACVTHSNVSDLVYNDFFVGEGVLIPREDTSVVVQLCLDNIKNLYGTDNLSVIDLCAGSGAISISLAKALPNSRVTALELSDKAIYYLQKNIHHNGCGNVEAVKGNVFTDFNITDAAYDVIISNPPYIISSEIKTLQREVQYEPAMALDGGSDGYDFYRAIISKWSNKLKSGGLLVFELGENQYDAVSHLMYRQGYKDITFATDLGDVKRGICGVKI